MSDQTVTISLTEYIILKEDSLMLQYLNEAGVDNWEGYSDAYQLFRGYSEDEEEDDWDDEDVDD